MSGGNGFNPYSIALGSQRPKGISDILHSFHLPTTGYNLKLSMPLSMGSVGASQNG